MAAQSALGVRRFLTKRDVADRYSKHPATIDRWVRIGSFPQPGRVCGVRGTCVWAEDALAAWENQHLVQPEMRAALAS